VVEYGKHEEEERLTGRRETRHSFLEWCSVFAGAILLAICLAVTILFTFSLAIRARDATLAAPGQRYFVNSHQYQVHVHCVGDKSNSRGKSNPTVFLEGGEDPVEGRLESWVKEAYNSSTIKRYCYWDRPGMAWSDNAPSPASAGKIADALSEALIQANENGPWILVSHGIGGIYSRIFASRHASDVRGLLLIDAFPESLLHRISSPGRGFMLWVRGVISPLGIDRIISATFMGRYREDRIYGRNAYQKGGQIKAKLQENLIATSFTLSEVLAAKSILPKDTPIVVVSSGKAVKKDKEWNSGQRALTRLSDNLIAWDVVNGADHDVWKNEHGRKLLEKRLVQLVNSD
jgi:pimeloyl-ACP methyl ester carboxylesterase